MLVAAGILALGFYPTFRQADKVKSEILPLMIWRDAAMAVRRVEMAENIRAGKTETVLQMLESQLYMDKDYLSANLAYADSGRVEYVEAAIATIEEYQRRFKLTTSYIAEP